MHLKNVLLQNTMWGLAKNKLDFIFVQCLFVQASLTCATPPLPPGRLSRLGPATPQHDHCKGATQNYCATPTFNLSPTLTHLSKAWSVWRVASRRWLRSRSRSWRKEEEDIPDMCAAGASADCRGKLIASPVTFSLPPHCRLLTFYTQHFSL